MTCLKQAEMLLGCSQLKDIDTAKQAVTKFYSQFSLPGCILITLGGEGLVYAADAKSPVVHIPAESVDVTDTTVSSHIGI